MYCRDVVAQKASNVDPPSIMLARACDGAFATSRAEGAAVLDAVAAKPVRRLSMLAAQQAPDETTSRTSSSLLHGDDPGVGEFGETLKT